jgi:hypothetical protein
MVFATYASILTPARSNVPCRYAFSAGGTLPYHDTDRSVIVPGFGAMLEPRYIFRAVAFDQ